MIRRQASSMKRHTARFNYVLPILLPICNLLVAYDIL